jgi:hypothetical protein
MPKTSFRGVTQPLLRLPASRISQSKIRARPARLIVKRIELAKNAKRRTGF